MINVGSYGFSWSSTILSGNAGARYLDLNFNNVNPYYSIYRSNGLPLRCLQE
ncbi:MAG: hypothetical protein K2K83_06010 [Rikenella sp.]|nr:hypothetical protein [Rikenella sp.]